MENEKVVMILEDMRSDFRAFKESLNATNEKLDQAVDFLQNMLFEHEKWLQEHEVRLKTVEKKVA